MSLWAAKRRTMYISGVAAFFFIVFGIPLYIHFKKPPTCFDGKRNQDERGIDCGGVCSLMCSSDVSPLAVLWSRTFAVSKGFYNSIAYIENPNTGMIAYDVPYIFTVVDAKNLTVAERTGKITITSTGNVPIFEGAIDTGWQTPMRTFFRFTQEPKWYRIGSGPIVTIRNLGVVSASGDNPRIEALVTNGEVYDLLNIEVIVTVFNSAENAIAASRTILPILLAQETKKVTFTWPEQFSDPIERIEIIPRVPPQKK